MIDACERAAEFEGEHAMNCDDPDCLSRDAREAEVTAEYEALQDRIDDCLEEYHRQVRERNVRTLSRGVYRVELSGRRDTDPVNLRIEPNKRDPEGLRFGVLEDHDSMGRVTASGRVYLWPGWDANDEHVKRARKALDVLLGSETPGSYGKAYARHAGVCYRCNALLTKEDSIDRMTGPVCARKIEAGER